MIFSSWQREPKDTSNHTVHLKKKRPMIQPVFEENTKKEDPKWYPLAVVNGVFPKTPN